MTTTTTRCESCQLMRIQGLICHETGCPDAWLNPVTGLGYPRECRWCGSTFTPEARDHVFCDRSCAESY